MKPGVIILGLCLIAAPALAQTPATPPASPALSTPPGPSPPQRRMVVDLAYVLGEAHALHRLCAGVQDNTWRGRMSRLLKAEAPDAAYRQQLMDSFNAGFVSQKAEFPTCTLKSADAEKLVAARGRDLSRRLAAGVSP